MAERLHRFGRMLDHRSVEVPARLSRRHREKLVDSEMQARNERAFAASKARQEAAAQATDLADSAGALGSDRFLRKETRIERVLSTCMACLALPTILVGAVAALATLLVLLFGPGYLIDRVLGVPSVVTFAATFVLLGGGFFILRVIMGPTQERDLLRSTLHEHLCPACGHSLRKLHPDGNTGLVSCPECGSGWKMAGSTSLGCGECGHALTGEVVDDSGYVSCPECGSAHLPISEDQLRGTAFDPASYSADGARPLE